MLDEPCPPLSTYEMTTNHRYGSAGSFSEDDVSLDDKDAPEDDKTFAADHPATGNRGPQPKDPRSSAYHKYNIFSRLLFL